ncbi:MAG TPA: HYR domain-containing protein [Blastocatellia bacterium]|nr:HYR domain-containing protein [Blastocatellia bacterium]
MNKKNNRNLTDTRRESQKARGERRSWSLWSAITITTCIVALVAAGLLSTRTPKATAAAQMINGISPEAMTQIEALIREKDGRRGVELKMDSQLIYELKMRRGQAVADGIQRVETDIEYDNQGKVELDIKAVVSDTLLAQLRGSGARVVSSVASEKQLRILVNIDQVESIAALPSVEFIQPKQEAMTAGTERPQRKGETPRYQRPGDEGAVVDDVGHGSSRRMTSPGFDARAARVQDYISAAISGAQPNVQGSFSTFTGVGSRSSEGDITHRANTARGTFHVNGTGVKIGVLSDGVTNLAASQALGDLGPVTVLPGQAGSGDEGTAMLEIIHDLAPGAQLFFATAFNGITSFAQNIRDLRTAGCDIIVDDVFYYVETPFQDGQAPGIVSNTNGGAVIQAVNDVTAAGAMFFSSAGNSGNLTDGTAGVWEGDFVDGGATGSPIPAGSAGNFHNFGGQNFNTLTVANTSAPISLYWSDPLGGSSNDYDLFRLNAAGTAIAASSTNIQNGTQDPYEQISQSTANPRVVIVKKTGAANRFLHLNANRGRFSIVTSGQTHGHSHAANAFSCAATPAVGPFPNPHSGANLSETFTSDGPRRIFYQADGTPYTPMNFSSTGGIVRQKPDITAADGVMVTGVGGFPSPFFGTSASAPHAAAIAGLLKSANPAFTPAQIRTALTSSAIDIEAAGVDRDTGAGIITAFGAMQALGVAGTAFLEFVSITANEDPGDGNGQLDAGDGANLSIQLKNSGVVNATMISATLATSTPGITVHSPNVSAYPDLAALGGTGSNATLYRFTIASNVTCPTTINFTLTATFTGGGSPQVLNFTVPVGPPAVNITSTLDTTAPTAGTGFTTTTGTIGVRHFRDGIASTCAAPKVAFPGTTQPGTRQYDAYTFTTCGNSGASCVTVTFSGANAINLYTAAYTGNFNPADLSQNFLADPGTSAATRVYSFNVPAGAQTFTIIVYDVPPGLAAPSGSTYTLNVAGSCIGPCATPNQVPVAMCQSVTVSAGANCTANASINNGSFDPDGPTPTITQTPPSPYPLGMTSVLLTVTDQRGATSQCTATVTVVDTTPPSIGPCSANITGATAATCPISTSGVVTYATPPVTDNCGVSSVVCTPPSGSSFPVGTTMVTCTATDNSGNTATCTFAVSIFNVCLQDDSNPNNVLLINTATGAYKFCCGGTTYAGTGTVSVRGCTLSLQHNGGTWRVNATIDQSQFKGTASLQSPPGVNKCTITDRDTRNNTCNCQ